MPTIVTSAMPAAIAATAHLRVKVSASRHWCLTNNQAAKMTKRFTATNTTAPVSAAPMPITTAAA